ncbi:deoxynucleoside kinase [Membranihabitans marinus]|uniref:deoxynucleoside kinase n=1 Tax=Membranihabitans marinus TaxID=1227546 RepID=UPI001F160CD8|nr:deoxynucleoside kinase [Membranihabitans marinus]
MDKIRHIAVAGNIGAGKTTLTNSLSKYYGWHPHYENASQNPYLSDFYNDMKRWAFNLQIYFLNTRYRQIVEIQQGDQIVIQDRTIYEDAHIFAPNLHEMGLMAKRDYDNYTSLFETMTSHISPPDLLIYIRAGIPTLVTHIQDRGRKYEGNMSLDYLKKLNKRYEEWISTYNKGPLLIINADELNFKNNPEHLGDVIDKVNGELHGLF